MIFEPTSVINNKPSRQKRTVISRPITDSGLDTFKVWIQEQSWEQVKETHDVNTKTNLLLNILTAQFKKCFPEKELKHTSDDSPWICDRVKKIKRLKSREYSKHRKSVKWVKLEEQYKSVLVSAKQKYYKNIVSDLKTSKPSQWYSKIKRICAYDKENYTKIECDEIEPFSDAEQAEMIAEHFASPRNQYNALQACDIQIHYFKENSIPQFSQENVKDILRELNVKKSVPPGDIPTVIFKKFSNELAQPVTNVINQAIIKGVWPDIFKTEFITPIPKVFPPKKLKKT